MWLDYVRGGSAQIPYVRPRKKAWSFCGEAFTWTTKKLDIIIGASIWAFRLRASFAKSLLVDI